MLWVLNNLVLVTALTILIAVALVLAIFFWLTRHYPHQETRAGFGAAMASLVITALLSVMLNHLWAAKRDRDNRMRNLRDQHYAQLRPVLRMESSKLTEIADTIGKFAHMNRVNRYEGTDTDISAMLWPDVLSADLSQHFPLNDKGKHALFSQIDAQDQEFRETVVIVERDRNLSRADPYWRDVDAMSFVEKCLGHGKGVVLRVMQGGYSFEYWGAMVGGSGRQASPDQVAAYHAFELLKPTAEVVSHCNSLKNRAERIRNDAMELSRQAQRSSESTILPGTCDLMTSRSLSD